MAASLTTGATAHGRLILAWAISGHHWLLLQASYDKLSPRVKLLALPGLPLCIQQRGACSVTWIRFISRRTYIHSCVLALAGGICCCNVDRHVLITLMYTSRLGYLLHGETAWWLTSSMNGRPSSYRYKHLQQTNMMHHKRPCGQPCVPKLVALAMPCYRCHAATTSFLKTSTPMELEVPVHRPNIATMAAGRTRLPAY